MKCKLKQRVLRNKICKIDLSTTTILTPNENWLGKGQDNL